MISSTNDNLDFGPALERAKAISSKISSLVEIVESEPDSAPAMLAAGKIYEIEGDPYGATQWYSKAIGLDPSLHEARARLALALAKANLNSESLAAAIELIQEAGEFKFCSLILEHPLSSYSVLGESLRINGQEEAAIEAYKKGLEILPEDTNAAGRLGTALALKDNFEEANEVLKNIDENCTVFSAIAAGVRLATNEFTTQAAIKEQVVSRLAFSHEQAA